MEGNPLDCEIRQFGDSRSFPPDDEFPVTSRDGAGILMLLGTPPPLSAVDSRTAVLIELGTECLGVHTGETDGAEGSNRLGFARYRNGDDPPSRLIEVVRQPQTDERALEAAREFFEATGFAVAVCADQPGRIIDRLVRPKYNAALRFLDEGLATAEDMDRACRMGLGYPDGPVERVLRGGLDRHHDICVELFRSTGAPAHAPARRAVVAKARETR